MLVAESKRLRVPGSPVLLIPMSQKAVCAGVHRSAILARRRRPSQRLCPAHV